MPAALRPDWTGRTVVCVASGPSLTKEDVQAISGLTIIVTNTSFRIAPMADVLFGFDLRWWREHIKEVRETFRGRLVSASRLGPNFGTETVFASNWFRPFGNSGACAVSFAIGGGASRVILLGFDCKEAADGRKHWHGDHPSHMSNCASMKRWPEQFKRLADYARQSGVQVLNCSRSTALGCFERAALEDVLAKEAAAA